jgi:hypothetical protein
MRSLPLLLLLALAAPALGQPHPAGTAVKPPMPEEYPAGPAYTGRHHAPVLATKDEKMFRTRLRVGAKGKVDFAGHYVLATWGCGTQCLMGAAIDVRTGKVFMIPFTLCCWGDADPFAYARDSRLIAFYGQRDENEPDGTWYYRIDDKKGWVVVREVPRPPLGQG